jgi:PAS domain S-box-containing protein
MRIRFNKKLIARLSLVALICAVITGFFFHYSSTIKTTSNLVSHSQEEVEQLKKLFSVMQDCETGSRGFVITKDNRFLEPYIKAVDSLPKVLNRLNELFRDDPSQQKNSVSLSFFINKKLQTSRQSITTRREKDFNAAMELMAEGNGKRTMDTIRILVDKMIAHENKVLKQRKIDNQKQVFYNNTILLAIIVFFVIVLFLLTGKIVIYLKEKRTTERKLKESNDRFNFVSKATADAIWDCDLKTGKVLREDNFEILFGHKLKSLDPNVSYWEKFIHPEDKERVTDGIHKLKNSKETNWKDEYRFLKADGTYAYILDKALLIRDAAGVACRMIGSMRDITERKEAEIKIQQSEAKYRQIVETAQEGIWMVDKTYTTAFVNKKMCDMLGYSTEEFVGKKNTDFMDEEGVALVLQNRAKRFVGVDEHTEMKFITKTGASIWTSVAINTNIDSDGNLAGGMAMFTDITNRKKAEEQLKSSEEGLRLLIENLKDYAIYSIDTDGNILTWNNGAKKMKGYDASEVIGKHISIFYNEDDRRNNLAITHLKEAEQNGSLEIDGLHVRKDGSQFWANSVFTAIYKDSGKLYGFAKITRDVTDKKQSEQKLQELSEKLSLATSTSNIGIWELNLINNKATMDDTSWSLFGLTSHEPMEVEELMKNFIHPEDLPKMQQALADAISNKNNLNIEYRVVWLDHSIHYLVSSGTVQLDDSREVTGLLGTHLDLTERRKSEVQLIASERNLNAILKSTQGALYLLDLDFKLVLINESARNIIIGLTDEECKIGDVFINYFDRETNEGLKEAFLKVLQGNQLEVEREIPLKGKMVYLHSTYFPVKDEHGNITNICCSSKDITEKKNNGRNY